MTDERTLLLSLRPRYAHAILDGSKTVEVRKRRVGASPGTRVILYASSPRKAVVGTARLRHTVVCAPEMAWRDHGATLGLARHEFDNYIAGRSEACLLLLENVQRLEPPLELADLRRTRPFQPPQSYRYVSGDDPARIRELIALE